jgi:hypothetical protein
VSPAGSPEDNLATVWEEVAKYGKAHPAHGSTRYGGLQLSMFTDPEQPLKSFPKLKGKGSEVKHLVPALEYAWNELVMKHNAGNEIFEYVSVGLAMSRTIDEVIDNNPTAYKFEGAVLEQYQSAIFVFLAMQNALAVHFNSHGYKVFNITLKSHYLAHGALQAAFLNPRLAWCFGGEDFMQTMKRVGGMCGFGTSIYRRAHAVMERYSAGMHFLMQPVSRWWR